MELPDSLKNCHVASTNITIDKDDDLTDRQEKKKLCCRRISHM